MSNNIITFKSKQEKRGRDNADFDDALLEELEMHSTYLELLYEHLEEMKPVFGNDENFMTFFTGISSVSIETYATVLKLKDRQKRRKDMINY